ncbi:MAG: DUF3857 domain-containing protein [Bacteroidota bacterium]
MKLYRVSISLFFIGFFTLLPCILFSQEPPIRWGNIPPAQLKMISFPQDTSASAVILCDYGESSFNDDLFIVYKRHLRIKILTERGYKWGTHSVLLYTADTREHIHDIEGVTYSLDEKNRMVKSIMTQGEIVTTKLDNDHTQYTFTLPGLKPGCIVEFRYTIISEFNEFQKPNIFQLRNWVFQCSEPVLWSEYRVRHPQAISYTTWTHGYEPFFVNEITEIGQTFTGDAGFYLTERSTRTSNANTVPCWQRRWVLRDAPALREEPYSTTMDDHKNSVYLQLSGYIFYSIIPKKIANTWPLFVNNLLDDGQFGGKIDNTRHIRKQAEQITAGLTTPEEKMKAIYDWTRMSVVSTNDRKIIADQDVDDLLKTLKGTYAETSFLLLSLLHAAGIEADPVILSTRDRIRIQETFPIFSEFNDVLVRARIDSQMYYLDATDPLRPMELLPPEVLNERGLVARKDTPEWVTLKTAKQYNDSSFTAITLRENGGYALFCENVYKEYGGLEMRHKLKESNPSAIVKDYFPRSVAEMTVDSVRVSGEENFSDPLKINAWTSFAGVEGAQSDLISFNPHMFKRMVKNPFQSSKRNFPIDYSYERKEQSVIDIILPDNFDVRDTIPSRSITLEPNLAFYSRRFQRIGSLVRIIRTLEIQKSEIESKYYRDLQEFYSRIVDAESEQLIFARTEKSNVAPPVVPLQQKRKK